MTKELFIDFVFAFDGRPDEGMAGELLDDAGRLTVGDFEEQACSPPPIVMNNLIL